MNRNAASFDPSGQGYQQSTAYQQSSQGGQEQSPLGAQSYAMYGTNTVAPADNYYSGGGYCPQAYGQDYDYPSAQEQTYGDWQQMVPQDVSATAQAGSYYPVADIQARLFGAPVSAIAYDDSYSAMYASGFTQSISSGRRWGHRASMLATHSSTDGGLYASVAGHPEAPVSVLSAVYESIYGEPSSAETTSSPGRRHHIPSHAYRPPYGMIDPALPDIGSKSNFQMGINTLLPTQGYVASVSPAGVRLHAHGGLQVADHHVEGMICGTAHPNLDPDMPMTHITVGGAALGVRDKTNDMHTSQYQLLCIDLWQGIRTVASHQLSDDNSVAVTSLATSHSKGSIVAGCSDGQIRMFDSRSLRELAKLKSHAGGVVYVAVSQDGTLLATTGYGSRATRSSAVPLYGFPDPTICLYDLRYLGRGAFRHPFTGYRGGPRHLSFLPNTDGQPTNRFLVASGQPGGGLEIIVPFEEASETSTNYILPPLERGESISAVCVAEDNLALGTSQGRVMQYRMAASKSKSAAADVGTEGVVFTPSGAVRSDGKNPSRGVRELPEKRQLVMPPLEPPTPSLSLEPSLLRADDTNVRMGMNDKTKSIFSAYILSADATVTEIGDPADASRTSFGPLATNSMLCTSRLHVSPKLLTSKATHTVDFLQTVPTSDLGVDLFEDHRPERIKARRKKQRDPLSNPNKLLHVNKLFSLAYDESLNRSKRSGRRNRRGGKSLDEGSGDEGDHINVIPPRYRLTMRPTHISAGTFSHADLNKTGLLPGYDYPPTMPNAFVPPVLVLLYFVPEVRAYAMESSLRIVLSTERSLSPELGFVFHRIDSLARFAMVFPTETAAAAMTRIEPWAPTNFISCLADMPEAEQLQILDGSPAAVDMPRRPEAFYRFLLYQLDKEIDRKSSPRLMDSLGGIDFVSVNEFVSGSGPPSESTNRALTIDLAYEPFLKSESDSTPSFGDVLQRTLCRETRLRAWNQSSKSYETIIQRKITTSLPTILSLTGGCAGRKEEEGLELWRGNSDAGDHWLPEMIEIELEVSGNVVVRQLVRDEKSGSETWKESKGAGSIPSSISKIVAEKAADSGPRKRRYRLDAVVSMVRDDYDRDCPEEVLSMGGEGPSGHHILHARVRKAQKIQILAQQIEEIEKIITAEPIDEASSMTIVGSHSDKEILRKRLDHAKQRLDALDSSDGASDSWILVNGYVVSDTVVEDARAFHVKFKQPSLIVFRAVQDTEDEMPLAPEPMPISTDVIKTLSITDGSKSLYAANQKASVLPGKGELIAFDAEFVSVQEEESTLTETGSKVTVRETRHAVARISIIDCHTRAVVLDDWCLPREPVVDYLTRFSGIVEKDLNPKLSLRHLISARAAYLKLRCLMERGCIFVGHGLQQDFWTVNLAVPASQIIDTVEIYHKPAQRYISLRFLTNFVLKRDMQQDVHDSVEDALAAYELYIKAVELKKSGKFEKLLNDLYEYGQKTDWRLGVD